MLCLLRSMPWRIRNACSSCKGLLSIYLFTEKNAFCLIWIAIQQSPPPPPQSENTATATVAAYLERRSVPGASIFVLILSTTWPPETLHRVCSFIGFLARFLFGISPCVFSHIWASERSHQHLGWLCLQLARRKHTKKSTDGDHEAGQ